MKGRPLASASYPGRDKYSPSKSEHTFNYISKPEKSDSSSTLMSDNFSSSDDGDGDNNDSLPTTIHRPFCHNIFDCGPSQIHPSSEIQIKTSDLSPEIVHIKSDVSSCSSDGTFHESARDEKNLDKNNLGDMQSYEDNLLLDSYSEWNQPKIKSAPIRGNVDVGEEISKVTQSIKYIDNSTDICGDKYNPETNVKSAFREFDTSNNKHKGRHQQRDECMNEKSECLLWHGYGIFHSAEEALHKISSCVGRLICHEEDDDLELINKLEKQESDRALSQEILDRTDWFHNSYITRSTYSIIKMENLYEGQDLFENESIFNRSSISLGSEGQIILSPTNRREIFREYDVDDTDRNDLSSSHNNLFKANKPDLSSTSDEYKQGNRESSDHSRNEPRFSDQEISSIESTSADRDEVPKACVPDIITNKDTLCDSSLSDNKTLPTKREQALDVNTKAEHTDALSGYVINDSASIRQIVNLSSAQQHNSSGKFSNRTVNARSVAKDQLDSRQQVDFRDIAIQLEGEGTQSADNGFISDDDDDSDLDDVKDVDIDTDFNAEKSSINGVDEMKENDDDDGWNKSVEDTDSDDMVVVYRRVACTSDDGMTSNIPDSASLSGRTFSKDQHDSRQHVDFRDIVIQLEGVGTQSAGNGFISDDDDDNDDDLIDANNGSSSYVEKNRVDSVYIKGNSDDDGDRSKSILDADNDDMVAAYRRAAHTSDDGVSSSMLDFATVSSRTVYAGIFTKDQHDRRQHADFRDIVIQLEGVGTRSADNGFISDDDEDDVEDLDTGTSSHVEKNHVDSIDEKDKSENDGDRSKSGEDNEDVDNDDMVSVYRRASHTSDDGVSSSMLNLAALSSRTVYAGILTKDQHDSRQHVDFRDIVIQLEGVGTRSSDNGFISDDDEDDVEDLDIGTGSYVEENRIDGGDEKEERDDGGRNKSIEDTDNDGPLVTLGGVSCNIPDLATLPGRRLAKLELHSKQHVDFRDIAIQLENVGKQSADNGYISTDDDDDNYDTEAVDNYTGSFVEKNIVDSVDEKGETDHGNNDGPVAAYRRVAHSSDDNVRSRMHKSRKMVSDTVTTTDPTWNELYHVNGVIKDNRILNSEDGSSLRNNFELLSTDARQTRSFRYQDDTKERKSQFTSTSSTVQSSENIQEATMALSIPSVNNADSLSNIMTQKLSTIVYSNGDDLKSSSVEATRRRGTAAILSAANELISKTQSRMQIKSQVNELQKMLQGENNEANLNTSPTEETENSSVSALDTATERLKERKERLQKRRERIEKMRQSKGFAAIDGLDMKSMEHYDDENRSDYLGNQALSEFHADTDKGLQSSLSPIVYHQEEKNISSETSTTGIIKVVGHRAGSSHHVSPQLEEKSRRRALMFQKFRLQLDKAKALASSE